MLREGVSRRESLYGPLAGAYRGVLRSASTGEERRVSLVLVPMILIVQNPGRNDVSEIPTLGGNLNLLFEGENDFIPIAQFGSARFETETSRLLLSGSMSTGTSVGSVYSTLDGTARDGGIFGRVTNSTVGELGTLEVRKAER